MRAWTRARGWMPVLRVQYGKDAARLEHAGCAGWAAAATACFLCVRSGAGRIVCCDFRHSQPASLASPPHQHSRPLHVLPT
jgi:hypothetical protein